MLKILKLPRPSPSRSQRLSSADRTGVRVGKGHPEVGEEAHGTMGVCVA